MQEIYYKIKKVLLINTIIESTLKILAKENLIEGGGLKQWKDTHWHTMYDCVFSVIKHKVPLETVKLIL